MRQLTRRHALTGFATTLTITRPGTALGSQANSAVSFGIIGTGGRGRHVGKLMARDPRARLAAICDIYPDRIDLAKTQIPGAGGARVYRDYRELLAREDIDAVLIATPVFLHPEHFEAAAKANKHIYCEKPAGADVAGVKRLMRAVANADRSKTIAFGFQQRFSPEYLAALNLLRTGQIGDLNLMISYWVWGGSAFRDLALPALTPQEDRIRNWDMYKATSGDFIVEQDCHGVDVLNWFAQSHPLKALGDGGRKARKHGDNLDHVMVAYQYPAGLKGWLLGSQLPPKPYGNVREEFIGTLGWLETSRKYYSFSQASKGEVQRVKSKADITAEAVEAFFRSIAEKKPYNMAPDAVESTLTSILGRMACERRREVTWDEMMRSA